MRTSDTLPSFFQSFYELTGNEQWLSIKEKMLAQLDAISSKTKTGLLPDFMWVDEQGARVADPDTIESKYDGAYSTMLVVCHTTWLKARTRPVKNWARRCWISS